MIGNKSEFENLSFGEMGIMKNIIKKSLMVTLAASSLILSACNSGGSGVGAQDVGGTNSTNTSQSLTAVSKKSLDANFIRAAYIDITAAGAFSKITSSGFSTPNLLILGFADTTTSTLSSSLSTNVDKAITASAQGAVILLSIGGEKATTSMNVTTVYNNISNQIDTYNKSHSRQIDGVDLDLENGVSADTIKQLAQKFKAKGYIVTGAPQIYTSSSNISSTTPTNMILTSGGNTGNTYQAALSAGAFDAILVQTYNTPGFSIDDVSENQEKFYLNAAKALAAVSNQKECTSDTKICIPSTTKVVVTTVANSSAASSAANIFGTYPSGENQSSILSQLKTDINTLNSSYAPVQYAGVAVWASTNDYDPTDYGDKSAGVGTFTSTILTMSASGRPANPDPIIHVVPTPGPGEYLYPDGLGTYTTSSIVIDADTGKKYQCKVVGWCNSSSPVYAPTGSAGSSAWSEYTGPTPSPTVTPSPTPTPSPEPTPTGDIKDYGVWDATMAYTPAWVGSGMVYPVVSYEGKKWIACSQADAGGKPGHNVWPDNWNSWIEYNGSSSVCP